MERSVYVSKDTTVQVTSPHPIVLSECFRMFAAETVKKGLRIRGIKCTFTLKNDLQVHQRWF